MIEFHRGEDDRVGKVMQKLRSLIEECGVVFIAFQDKVLPCPKHEARPKVFRDSANQERGSKSSRMEDPGQHRSRCGFAMGSSHHQHVLALQKLVVQDLRQGTEWDPFIQNVFQFDVAARDRIPDHNQIGMRHQILRVKWLRYGYSQGRQKVRHGGIGGGIGAGYTEATFLQHSRERCHRGATDTDQMYVSVVRHDLQFRLN